MFALTRIHVSAVSLVDFKMDYSIGNPQTLAAIFVIFSRPIYIVYEVLPT